MRYHRVDDHNIPFTLAKEKKMKPEEFSFSRTQGHYSPLIAVLSTGATDTSGNLTGNAQLFCFGAP